VDKIYFRLPFKEELVSNLCGIARSKKDKEIIWLVVIDTNTHAIEFYKKLGFEIHSRTILDIPYFKEALKGM